VGLERDPLSLVRIIEELLEWKSSGSGSRKPRLRPWYILLTSKGLLKVCNTKIGKCQHFRMTKIYIKKASVTN
jgi:hypothetical protein